MVEKRTCSRPGCPLEGQVHERCVGHTQNGPNAGNPCGCRPLTGQQVCLSHGGGAKQNRAAGARRQQTARLQKAVHTLGLPRDVLPTEALLEEVRWTSGHVHWLRERVQELEQHALVWGTTRVKEGGDDRGQTQEAKPNALYALYASERAHLVRVCSETIRAGVEERKVRLAEEQGQFAVAILQRSLDLVLGALKAAGLPLELERLWPTVVGDVVPKAIHELKGEPQ